MSARRAKQNRRGAPDHAAKLIDDYTSGRLSVPRGSVGIDNVLHERQRKRPDGGPCTRALRHRGPAAAGGGPRTASRRSAST